MSSASQRMLLVVMLAAAPAASGMYAFSAPPLTRGLPFYYYTPVLEAPPSPVDLWHNAFERLAHHPAYRNPLLVSKNKLVAQSDSAAELADVVRHLLGGGELKERPAASLPGRWTDDGDGECVSTTLAFSQPVTLDEVSAQQLDEGLVHIRSEHKLPYGVSTSSTQLKLPFAVSSPEAVALELAEDGKSVTISVRKSFEAKPLEPSHLSITAAPSASSTASIAAPSPSPAADVSDHGTEKAEGASHKEHEQAADEAELDHKFSFVAEGNGQDKKRAEEDAAAAKQAPPPDAPGVGFEFEKADEPVDAK